MWKFNFSGLPKKLHTKFSATCKFRRPYRQVFLLLKSFETYRVTFSCYFERKSSTKLEVGIGTQVTKPQERIVSGEY